MKKGIERLEQIPTVKGGVVLGEPEFYTRFGFACCPNIVLPDVPPEYSMVLQLCDDMPHNISDKSRKQKALVTA